MKKAKPMNPRQVAVLRLLGRNHGVSTGAVGSHLVKLKLVKSSGGNWNENFPAAAVLRSLGDNVTSFPSKRDCQWAVKLWCLSNAGRELFASLPAG